MKTGESLTEQLCEEANSIVENGSEKDTTFREVQSLLYDLQVFKGKTYGSSWCKHGEAISIFGNTSRKYDRLETIMKNFVQQVSPLPPPDSDESVAETVADLANYCILWMTWIKQNRPQEYAAWASKIRKVTQE